MLSLQKQAHHLDINQCIRMVRVHKIVDQMQQLAFKNQII